MRGFEFTTAKKLICAVGAAARLAEYCQLLGIRRPMLVTDQGCIKAGVLASVLQPLQDAAIEVLLYSDIQPDPSEQLVLAAVAQAQQAGIDGVIAVGGGSSLDVAKLLAVLLKSTQPLTQMYGIENITGERLPLILVPTTAGTGSEVTPIAIITTGTTTKSGVVSSRLLPDIAILDASLTVGLPAAVTAATAIDAMVHAIEAFTSKVKKNPYSDMLAKEALRLIGRNLLLVVQDGSNLLAREKVLLGAMMAGQAFANAPVAAVHALAYPLGGNYHIPHGLSNALVLPAVLRFNAPVAAALYAELLPCVTDKPAADSDATACQQFIQVIETLISDVGLPATLSAMNVPEADLPRLATEAMLQQRLLINNPRDVTEADALAIYQAAYH